MESIDERSEELTFAHRVPARVMPHNICVEIVCVLSAALIYFAYAYFNCARFIQRKHERERVL